MSIIDNFKELLSNNYYIKDNEETEFNYWLEENIHYINGVYSVNERDIVNETEVTESDGEVSNLKSLVQEWCRSRKEKQEYWNSLFHDNIAYSNGVLLFDSVDNTFIKQEISGVLEYEAKFNNFYYYYLEAKITPSVSGQSLSYSPSVSVYDTISTNDGELMLGLKSTYELTSITVSAETINSNGLIYSGATYTIDVTE